jgi:hypothetical protein
MNLDPVQMQPYAHIWERAKRWIFDRTVAIYFRKPDGNPVQRGSGVLLQMGDAVFLVSASHVMAIVRDGVEILIGSMNVEAKGLVSTGEGMVVRTDEEQRDLALMRLPQSAIEALAPFKRFVQPAEIDLGRAMPQGGYYIAGYPIQLTRTDHSAKIVAVGEYTSATYLADSDHAHPGISIALAHDKDSMARSGDGERARTPHLSGVSGCGVWRLWADQHFERLAEWNESWIRLSGIEHRIVGEVIVGTMAFHVFQMILHTQRVELTLSPNGVTLRPATED